MKKIFLTLAFLALIVSSCTQATPPSPGENNESSYHKYFPLAVGNYWIFKPFLDTMQIKFIVSDSVIYKDDSYYEMTYLLNEDEISKHLVRIEENTLVLLDSNLNQKFALNRFSTTKSSYDYISKYEKFNSEYANIGMNSNSDLFFAFAGEFLHEDNNVKVNEEVKNTIRTNYTTQNINVTIGITFVENIGPYLFVFDRGSMFLLTEAKVNVKVFRRNE